MAYTKTNWVDDTAPYINAANLNKIEQGIEDAHNGVLATQLTGLIPINGTPLPSDSLLVAIGKLKNTADNPSSGALESFDVPISSGWQANLDETPSALQTFRKKSGVVASNGLYLFRYRTELVRMCSYLQTDLVRMCSYLQAVQMLRLSLDMTDAMQLVVLQ